MNYDVTVTELVRYRVRVTAGDADAARSAAIERVIEEGDQAGFVGVEERTADRVEPAARAPQP